MDEETAALDPLARYRRDGETVCVELSLRSPRQLFDVRDPAPFRARDLDDDAVEWLLGAVEEVPARTPVAFYLHFEEGLDAQGFTEAVLRDAIRAHFRYELARTRRAVRALMQQGLWSALLAGVLLALCMAAESALRPLAPREHWAAVTREGMVILGWVALWRPLETFLFAWWPYTARIRLLRRVIAAEVRVQSRTTAIRS